MEFIYDNKGTSPNQNEIEMWKSKAIYYENIINFIIQTAPLISYNPKCDLFLIFISKDISAHLIVEKKDYELYEFVKSEYEKRFKK